MSRLWIKGGRVLDPHSERDETADVLIENGRIAAIEARTAPEKPQAGEKVIDAKGAWVTPGLVDIHTHLRDPGYEYKENILTGTTAAIRGGFTAIVCMANTEPVNDNATVTEYIKRKARDEGRARVFPVGAVSKGLMGERLSNFGDLKEAGVVALSDEGKPVAQASLMRHALEYARNFDLPIISHCEDPTLFCGGHLNEGLVSLQLGLGGIPNAAEDIMVSRDIELAGLTRGRVHLAHLSTTGSVRMLREGKDRGIRVTGEVTPHHFTLTEMAVREYDTNAKMNPPLRTEEDRLEMIRGLKEGVFDAIALDHAPHSQDEKEVEFERAPFGIVGLETTVPLTLRLVHEGILRPLQAIRLLTCGPAKVMGLDLGNLKKGAAADVAIIFPDQEVTIDKRRLASKSKNTPFHGWKLKGAVRFTIMNGEVVYDAKA